MLRSFDDSLALCTAMATARSLLVIGAGFIGAEVATAARDRGLRGHNRRGAGRPVRAQPRRTRRRHRRQDGHPLRVVTLLTDRSVHPVDGDTEAVAVTLTDGSSRSADIAVVGVRSRVDTGWLAGARPRGWTRGITCDGSGRVQGLAAASGHVYALGDIARWHGERFEHGPRCKVVQVRSRRSATVVNGPCGVVASTAPWAAPWDSQSAGNR